MLEKELFETLGEYLLLKEGCTLKNKIKLFSLIQKSVNEFFSVWLEVFKEYPEVKKVILERANERAFECYDFNYNPVPDINRS